MAIIYGLKVNLSVAIVGMLNHTAIKMAAVINDTHDVNKTLPVDPERAKVADGPFEWSSQIQGIILSCYFWGYLVSQMPGGRIAEILSAKWVMFFSVTINVICTLLTPVMAQAHYIAVIFMRVGEGIGGGVTFPAMHVLLSKWAPPAERSVLSTLVYAGTALGTVISMFMAGVLTDNLGWESVFYVMGGLSCIWCILWVILVQDSPQQQSIISVEERNMIVTSLGGTNDDRGHKKLPVPWHAVLRSKPFWAILVAHTCSNWGWYMLLIKLPSYMHDVLHLNMNEIAVATSLSFLCLWFFSMALSKTLDWLRGKEIITTTTARKTSTLIASVVPTVCLLAICFSGDSRGAPVALMAIAVTSYGGMFCGFLSNHIDIAPNYAGSLMAITNTVATIPGIVVPVFVGSFIDNKI
ncbi:sialin [Hyposmocoma kahamanoa]|uniref:sialin n=1 Tax=Hyposmocoma kahamanoa TaxID=1477025 RepID=UPI000E6D8DBE|nr:sialin [Hyposmocoma kahamanoa]